jgi:succinyl-diaminopimelate desuccinylase
MHTIREILEKLVSYPSVTPHDKGCQEYMIQILETLGFHCQRFDKPPVANFYAQLGSGSPCLVFAGHTDVVPVGNRDKWLTDPFCLTEKNGMLYGRGVADMKGSLACMLVAAERFVENHPTFSGSLGFLITSGEEGDDYQAGTPWVMSKLQEQGIHPDFCIVGEPSSTKYTGDMLKIGRRGSLTAKLTLQGKQGHVAYPHLAENPVHKISTALAELTAIRWDEGNQHFPPTSLQVTHIHAGGEANNIIPGELTLHFNLRYSTEQTAETLKSRIETCFKNHSLNPVIDWQHSGEPFLTSKGQLLSACIEAIALHTGQTPELSTSGGTSDGRFIASYGIEVIELGPVNATIHQVNECLVEEDLKTLADIYYSVCEALIVPSSLQK